MLLQYKKAKKVKELIKLVVSTDLNPLLSSEYGTHVKAKVIIDQICHILITFKWSSLLLAEVVDLSHQLLKCSTFQNLHHNNMFLQHVTPNIGQAPWLGPLCGFTFKIGFHWQRFKRHAKLYLDFPFFCWLHPSQNRVDVFQPLNRPANIISSKRE